MKQTIDARGWQCPKPIIETKKLLDTMREGSVVTIVDNGIAVENLRNFSESLGYGVACEEKDGLTHVEVTKVYSEDAEAGPANRDLVIQVSSNTYGAESDGLGESLMKAYIYTLTEAEPKPRTLMFINQGVLLTTEGSPVLDSLYVLEAEGVEILTCGACLNFFSLADALRVGAVTNMYTMVERLNGAANSIKI